MRRSSHPNGNYVLVATTAALLGCTTLEYDPERAIGEKAFSNLRKQAIANEIAQLRVAAITYAVTIELGVRGEDLEKNDGNLRCTITLTPIEKADLRQAIQNTKVLNGVDGIDRRFGIDARWSVIFLGSEENIIAKLYATPQGRRVLTDLGGSYVETSTELLAWLDKRFLPEPHDYDSIGERVQDSFSPDGMRPFVYEPIPCS